MFCSLVAQLVSLACLIGIARCLESFQCVTELVLLHNRCHMVPLNDLFFWGGGVIYLQFVLWNSTRCGEPAIAAPFYSTLPTAASSGICVSFHTWCWFATWSRQSSKQLRSVSQTDAKHKLFWLWIFFFLFFWFAFNVPRWLTRIYSLSPWSHCLIDRQGITYRQMSTVIANWPLIHVLNTMFCEEGRDYITAITFSSGSQCANRFCVFFSSFG